MKTLLILLLFTGNAFALSHDAGQSVAGFESTYVNVTGDTMTGQLNVSSNVIVTSSVTAISFFGEGSNITDLDPTEITAGALDSDVIISSIAIGAIDHENQITDDLIINADINSAAGIAATKLADGTVTSAELQYINSLASNAQTQLDGITASTGTNATDIANIKISTGANKVLIDANTTQLTQVATDTTTISGIATTNQSQLTQVAVDTTTLNTALSTKVDLTETSSVTISNALGVTGAVIFGDDSFTVGGSTLVVANGKIGIGVNPTQNLEINTSVGLMNATGDSVFYQGYNYGANNYASFKWVAPSGGLQIGPQGFPKTLNMLTNGKVGISTDTPTYGLDVYGTGRYTDAVTLDSTLGVTGAVTIGGYTQLYSRSMAQLLAITPTVVGQQYFCNDCSPTKIVVSTGTSQGNFADAVGGAFE